ncbi:MAG: hypothetical protein ACKPKO_01880, partial [Candidatus Fonsibacter sp.]
INTIQDLGLDDGLDVTPIFSIKFHSVGNPFYILVIKHECKLLDGFRYNKELLMQMHNNKMLNSYDTFVKQ